MSRGPLWFLQYMRVLSTASPNDALLPHPRTHIRDMRLTCPASLQKHRLMAQIPIFGNEFCLHSNYPTTGCRAHGLGNMLQRLVSKVQGLGFGHAESRRKQTPKP